MIERTPHNLTARLLTSHAFVFLGIALALSVATLCNAKALPAASPAEVAMDPAYLDRIEPAVLPEIEAGNLPGCVVLVARGGRVVYLEAFGNRQEEPTVEPMTVDTVFDMASLTKPLATATSIMLLVERGQLRLGDRVSKYIPEFGANGKQDITVEQLLTHQGGLVPDNPLSDYQDGPEKAWERIYALTPTIEPGTRFVYTDVGFLVLGKLVQKITGQDAAEFAKANVYEPLGMNDTRYNPPASWKARVAPTERRDGEWLRGEVHDPRAALLDGVAGHAGLFSTAQDLAVYAEMMLSGGRRGPARVMSARTIAEMTTPRNIRGQLRGLGWDMASKYSSNRGELFSQRAFGHGGFTGTAMWIDPELDLTVVFLSNRLHPDGHGSVNDLAGRIGTLAAAAITGPVLGRMSGKHAAAEEHRPVLTGIDVLQRDGFRLLAGKRVGLITNHTGLDSRGRRTVDLLNGAENVELVCLFSPEHGIAGKLDQSNIDSTVDGPTGLPVHSLYGKTRRPDAASLKGLDALVYDIQDIGTRFYTYISTMGLAMEAAAEEGLEFIVLDRPNPIGGTIVSGPVLDSDKESFVGHHPIPVRHGMTVGEIARMFRAERQIDVPLVVVPVENWHRSDYWDRTGLCWVNPSPNMRSLAEAVLYPGIGLLETTNVSVGRGTDTPFEVVGAPWIDGVALAQALNDLRLPGVVFVPIGFTPSESKFANEECQGVNIVVTDRDVFASFRTGLAVAGMLRTLFPEKWEIKSFNRLLASDSVLQAVRSGRSLDEIQQLIEPSLREFVTRRAPFLIYDAASEGAVIR